MDWLNLHISVLDSEEVIGAEPVDRATWLFLLRYCMGQENGGLIRASRAWGNRKWQQIARVTLREVNRETKLWRWEGDDLRVNFYPLGAQELVQKQRAAGRDTVAKRWGKQEGEHKRSPDSSPTSTPDTKGKEKEGNVMEDQSLTLAGEVVPATTPDEIYAAYPRKSAKADALKAIAKALAAGKSTAVLLERTQAYAKATEAWSASDRQFIPHPATWFNRGSYDDDPKTWERHGGAGGRKSSFA